MKHVILGSPRSRFVLQAIALLAFAGGAMPALAQDNQPKAKVGDTAPDFTLKDHNGKEVSLKQLLAEKPTALVFYRSADW